jgi:hypothetical protein
LARGVRNKLKANGSNLIKLPFNTRAAESREIVPTFLVFPAASRVAVKPPSTTEPLAAELPTAAKPLSLLY